VLEVDMPARADAEAPPVDDRALRGLDDFEAFGVIVADPALTTPPCGFAAAPDA
jgi:hypothetical protein